MAAARFIRAGDLARDRRDWPRAIACYRRALRVRTDLAGTWIQYGHVLREDGRLCDAEGAYRSALRLEPSEADGHLQLGRALKLQGRSAEAASAYIKALKLSPNLRFPHQELLALGWSNFDISATLRDGLTNESANDERACEAARVEELPDFDRSRPESLDESDYLRRFADVGILMRLGLVVSARQHYMHYGRKQGRKVIASLQDTPPSRVFVLCPSFFKRCGIGEHARYLADSLETAGFETFRIRTIREMECYPDATLRDAAVVVNHGPWLFDSYDEELSEGDSTTDLYRGLWSSFNRLNLRPIVFMHTLFDCDNEVMFVKQHYGIESPVPIVTTIEAAARAFNILRIEHGAQTLPEFEPRALSCDRNRPTIGFFGFFQLRSKDFDSLVGIVQRLSARLVGSVATRDTERAQLLSILDTHGITHDLGTGWVSDAELTRRLSSADYYYLPQHDCDYWNNSGSARFVLNFGRPVLVPPHNPFLDLRESVIFTEQKDLAVLIASMRDKDVYASACRRSAAYVECHSMRTELPRLVTDLGRSLSEEGHRNFLEDSHFCVYRLASLPFEVFRARVDWALVAEGAPASCAASNREAILTDALASKGSALAMVWPVAAPVQYWRDHYQLEELLQVNATDAIFDVVRKLLKREPSYFEMMRWRSDFERHFLLGGDSMAKARLLLEFVANTMEAGAPQHMGRPVALYRGEERLDRHALNSPEIAQWLAGADAEGLALGGALSGLGAEAFVSQCCNNLFEILHMSADRIGAALSAVCRRQRHDIDFATVGTHAWPQRRFQEVIETLASHGLECGDLFVMDEPVAGPVDVGKRSYCIAEMCAHDDEAFVINLVRALAKRDPLIAEFVVLQRLIESTGKCATIAAYARKGLRNAVVVDLDNAQEADRLDAFESQMKLLIRDCRSPLAGGWMLRNQYLEAKRNCSRLRLKLKSQAEIWQIQSYGEASRLPL